MLRTFIGVHVRASRSIRKRLESLDSIRHPVRAVAPSNLHITLKFLGETPDIRIPEICSRLQAVASRQPPINATLKGIGCFPNCERPSVIWIGIREEESASLALASLAGDINDEMADIGFPPETRRYRSHLSLARIKGRAPQAVFDLIDDDRDTNFGELKIDSFHLIQSKLERGGPQYVDMASFPVCGSVDGGQAGS